MRIGMSMLSGVSYGGITYFKNLIPALARTDHHNEYHIFVPRNSDLHEKINQKNFLIHRFPTFGKAAWQRLCWEQLIMPLELKKKKIDIFFTAKNANIFLSPCPTIISIRNMEPFAYREYKNSWRLNFGSFLRFQLSSVSIKSADRIIAVSHASKNRVENLFPETTKRWDVVYNGNPVQTPTGVENYNSGKFQFFLSASKYVAYANQLNLVQAYILLQQRRNNLPPLLLAGGIHDRSYFKKIQQIIRTHNLQEKITILGLVPHHQLEKLYASAGAFIFPSTLEACPHTIIEAMAYGLPIAAANVEPTPEICQKAATYFNPFNPEDIATKMENLLCDEALRIHLRKQALERCQFFTWDKTAREMVKIFNKTKSSSMMGL